MFDNTETGRKLPRSSDSIDTKNEFLKTPLFNQSIRQLKLNEQIPWKTNHKTSLRKYITWITLYSLRKLRPSIVVKPSHIENTTPQTSNWWILPDSEGRNYINSYISSDQNQKERFWIYSRGQHSWDMKSRHRNFKKRKTNHRLISFVNPDEKKILNIILANLVEQHTERKTHHAQVKF